MKRYYPAERNTFFADNVAGIMATRNRGYEANNRGGRIKNAFIYTDCGRILYRFLDKSIPPIEARAGELVFLPKGIAYSSLYCEDGTSVKIVQFDLLFGSLPPSLAAPQKIFVHRVGDLISQFFAEARPHPLFCLSRLYELVYRVEKASNRMPAKFKKLQVVLDDMHANLTETHKISHYAALCDMSEAGFRRLFRELVGESPVDYRNALRLERARLLLENGDYNVSEAAEATGFSNLSFFIRLYKRKYGHTPKNG